MKSNLLQKNAIVVSTPSLTQGNILTNDKKSKHPKIMDIMTIHKDRLRDKPCRFAK